MAFRGDLDTLILAALRAGGLHGYEISKLIREQGCSSLAVNEGLLYPALHRLEAEGQIQGTWVPQAGKPDRRVYTLTDKGKGRLVEKREAWREFASGVDRLLDSPKPEATHG